MAVLQNHIEATPGVCGGKPRIVGRRITVEHIVIWHERMRMNPDEIAAEYDLTLGDVYAALTYYFDNREEINRRIGEGKAFAETMRERTTSVLRETLGGEQRAELAAEIDKKVSAWESKRQGLTETLLDGVSGERLLLCLYSFVSTVSKNAAGVRIWTPRNG